MADGRLVFDTKLDTSGIQLGLSQIGSATENASRGIAQIGSVAESASKGITQGVSASTSAFDALEKTVADTHRSMRLAEAQFTMAAFSMDDWRNSSDGLNAKLKQLDAVLAGQKNILSSLEDEYRAVAEEQGKESDRVKELEVAIAEQKAEISQTESAISNYQSQLQKLEQEQKNAGTAFGALSSKIDEQQSRLDELKEQYANVVLEQGKDSQAALELAKDISSLSGELKENRNQMEKAVKAADDLDESVEDAGKSAEKAEKDFKALKAVLAGMGSITVAAMKGIVAGVGAAAGAVAALTVQSVKSYAEYEQLEGGVKKLFGNMGKSLEEYAELNHKSVDEVRDKWQSLENAQNAMLANADNAWKSAGMSANEYIQNVTGFSAALINSLSGDTEEAARMADMAMRDIADNANTFGTYTVSELANVYQALAKGQYQTLDNLNLGFGGTKQGMQDLIDKANELAAAQGQAADLQIDSYADIVQAIHLVQESMNITHTTENEAATTIQGSIAMTKAAWENLLTGMSDSDADIDALVTNVIESAGTVLENLVPVVETALTAIASAVETAVPQIVDRIPQFVTGVVPKLMTSAATVAASLAKAILQNAPMLLQTGIDLLLQLADGIAKGLPQAVPLIVDTVIQIAEIILDNLDRIIEAGVEIIMALIDGMIEAEPEFLEKMPELVDKLAKALLSGASTLVEAILELAGVMLENFISKIPEYAKAGLEILRVLKDALLSDLAGQVDIGLRLVQGIWDGISSGTAWIKGKITAWVGDVVSFIKGLFGIHSPSKVMEKEVGKNIALGIIKGVDGEKKNAKKSAKELADLYVSAAKSRVSELKKANKLTQAQEISFWKEIVKQCEKGTKAYNSAVAQLTTAKNTLKKNVSELTKNYVSDIADIQEELEKDIRKLQETYEDAVASRTKQITGSFNLFDRVELDEAAGKEELKKNLSDQVAALEEWDRTLKSLEGRLGSGSSLYGQLKEMDVSSLETLKTINSMSVEELKSYEALYDRKENVAKQRAELENRELKEQTEQQTKELQKTAKSQMKELKKTYEAELKQLGVSSKKQSKDIGQAIVDGMADGIRQGTKGMDKATKKLAKSVVDNVKKELDIHSPSKKFQWIGKMCLEGFEQEFDSFNPYDSMGKAMTAGRTSMSMNYNVAGEQNGFDYDKNADKTVDAFVKAGITVEVDGRAFGRLIRGYA